MKSTTKGNKMTLTKQNAKLELFKIDRRIEKTLIRYNKELGQWNKNCLMNDLQRLWGRKKTLQNTINK
tara:strand:+ start:838 stop:1041 length:204 start_codon:yes stop_codon:yes gene_type:complete